MNDRARSLRAEGVVLRHQDWGEADRLLVVFTQELGKVRLVAKGVRKPRSRKAGHLEPFTRVSLQLARGREMMLVTQAETVDAFLPLRENLMLATYASYVVELLDRFTYEEGENRGLYRLLTETLARLVSEPNPDWVVRFYEVRMLDLLGFRPQLFTCLGCEEEVLPQDQFFSAERGGILCPQCGQGVPGVRPISMTALKYLRHLQRSQWSQVAGVNFAPSAGRELETLMQYYLTYLLERNLNSPAFLRRLRREARLQEAEQQHEEGV